MIVFGFAALDVCRDNAEVAVADIEDESGGSVGGPRGNHAAITVKGFEAIVARPGLTADGDEASIGTFKNAGQPPRGSAFDDFGHRLSDSASDFGSEHLLALFRHTLKASFVGCALGEIDLCQADRPPAHAVIEQYPDEIGQSHGPITRAADGARV